MIWFEEIPHEIQKVGKLYAVAKANADMLEESKKSVLASEASQYDWSEAYRERMARKSVKYKDFLKWWQQSKQKELELKYELIALQAQFDYFRSMNSVKKKEINNL